MNAPKYRTCQICARALRLRKDGKFPMHTKPNEFSRLGSKRKGRKLPTCMGSEVFP